MNELPDRNRPSTPPRPSGDSNWVPTGQQINNNDGNNISNSHQIHTSHNKPSSNSKLTIFKQLLRLLRSIIRNTTHFLVYTYRRTAPLRRTAVKWLKGLPWKVLVPIFIGIIIVSLFIFNFYLASTSRIVGIFESNYTTADSLEKQMSVTDISLSFVSGSPTELNEAKANLEELVSLSERSSFEKPPRLFSNYALKSYNGVDSQLDVLYDSSPDNSITGINRSTVSVRDTLLISSDLFTKDIQQDPEEYINFLDRSIDSLTEIEQNNSRINTDTLERIFRQIKESATQYQVTKDIELFNRQYSNVSSELYKESVKIWDATVGGPQREWVSSQRSSYSSILNTIDPNKSY